MFLGVHDNVYAVNEDERQKLAERLVAERNDRFKGSKKAAYTAAGVNSATWDRAEAGQSIKEHSRVAIVRALWPESGGDWTKIPEPDLTTWDDLANPRYDAKSMARRMDGLEDLIAQLLTRVDRMEEALLTEDDDADLDLPTSIAARKGSSKGRQLRAEQDAAGEESQAPGEGR